MPVAAKLSRAFYERFGDEIASELVTWMNAVDSTSRADLREFNESNFARFDAKLELRLTELRADMATRLSELRADTTQRLAELAAALRGEMAQGFTRMLKWMFAFWTGTALVIIGTGVAVAGLLLRR